MVKKILYLIADLRPVGPTRQTLNIIRYSGMIDKCVVLTLFPEINESLKPLYESLGIRVECLNLDRKLFVFYGVKELAKFCKKEQVDTIHSYGVKPDIVAHYAAKRAKIRHIITLRNFPMEDLSGRMNPYVGKIIALAHLHVLKRCKHLIACSKTIAQKMRDTYGVEITPIQNGVDTTIFEKNPNFTRQDFCKQFSISLDSKIFVSTNSFIPRKHNDEVVEAFLKADIKDSELFLLGDGFLLEGMRQKYAQHANVHFMGKRSDVSLFLQNSNAFISTSDSEGLPNAVLEALACGCPVILSDIPQHKEILDILPSCGTIFPLHDAEAIRNAIRQSVNAGKSIDTSLMLSKSPFTMEQMGITYCNYYTQV